MTQCERVLRHLQEYGSITRLSGRIYDLRDQGVRIKSSDTTGKNRYGETTHFTTYRLEVQ